MTGMIKLCVDDHPVTEHIEGTEASPVCELNPDYPELYYCRLQHDMGIVTYRKIGHDKTVQYHEVSWEEFEAKVEAGKLRSGTEVVTVYNTDTCIGDAIVRALTEQGF